MTEYTNREAIISALVDQGFDRSVIEIHDQAVPLSDGKRKAHIVIRKKDMKSYAWTDTGFELMPDGKYRWHFDEYTMNKDWRGQHHQRYNYHHRVSKAKSLGFKVQSEDKQPNGNIVLRLSRS